MELELAIARERHAHSGIKGGIIEASIRSFLERNLPRSLSVGTGEVIASQSVTKERRSAQIDVVISTSLQPFQGARDDPGIFFIEAVQAAGEVKTTLNRSSVKTELDKARRFKSLKAQQISRLVKVVGVGDWASYYVFYRPYFILTHENSGDWRSVLLEVMDYIINNNCLPVDGIFLLNAGMVILLSPHIKSPFARPVLPFKHGVDGKIIDGAIHIYKTDTPLVVFMAWLSSFRVGYLDDENPISFYINDALDESLSGFQLTTASNISVEERNSVIANKGQFEAIRSWLRDELS